MSLEDLERIQKAGWMIVAADDERTLARCPAYGCGLKVNIPHGSSVQACDPGLSRDAWDIPIGNYEDIRLVLKDRRQELLLTIPEVEDIAGLSVDHIAKAEKKDPARKPTIETMIYWAQALGFEILLRHTGMPKKTLRFIDETRPMSPRRRQMNKREPRPSRSA